MIGKAIHVGVDLVLVSSFLAGVKRTTGLSPKTELISNDEARKYTERYLGIGEWTLDASAAYMRSSEYFVSK